MNICKILILLNSYFENKFDYIRALINDKLNFDIYNLYYHINYLVKVIIIYWIIYLITLYFTILQIQKTSLTQGFDVG